MSEGGKGFGLELYQLEKVARSDLPTLASVYDDAGAKCDSAGSAVAAMPAVPEQFVNGSHGSVFRSYGELHDVVNRMLRETGTNLHETAEALHKAAQMYAENDEAAEAELRRLAEERGLPPMPE